MRIEKQNYKDIFLLLMVSFFVLLFLLPVALGWHGLFFDDIRTFSYPNAVFQARSLQGGIVPLWDPHTFAGASPFYARLDGFSWYLPQWIAAVLSNDYPSDRAYQQLILFPIVLHCLWAVAGSFILGRWGLRLSRCGASVMALIYSLSSSLMLGLTAPHILFSLAWQPWMAAAVLLYLRRRCPMRLIAGSVIFALGTTAWPVFGFHNLFTAGIFGFMTLFVIRKEEGMRSVIKGAAGLLVMVILSLLLTAPFWWALKDYIVWVSSSFDLSGDALVGGPRSVPPRYWATLFIPELFGSSNFSTFWGVAADEQLYWCEAYLTRGMLIWFPAVLAVWVVLRVFFKRRRPAVLLDPLRGNSEPGNRRDRSPRILGIHGFTERSARKSDEVLISRQMSVPFIAYYSSLNLWTWVSLGLLIFSMFLMAGRHTPIFGLLYKLCPLFRLPYPSRWHTVFSLSLAILSGIGVTRLLKPESSVPVLTRRFILTYLSLVTLIAAIAVFIPGGYWHKLNNVIWFLENPGLYWLIGTILIGSLYFIRCGRWAGRVVIFLALIGLFRSAWWDAYRPMGITWAAEQESMSWPSESPLYQFSDYAARNNKFFSNRTGYSRVFADNAALLYGGYNLLGVSVKPLEPRMYDILQELCNGWPYEISLRNPALPFIGNMSTEYWWYGSRNPPSTDWKYMTRYSPDGLFLFRIFSFLPRVFTLDRFQPQSEQEQRQDLIFRDLREVVLVDIDATDLKRHIKGRIGTATKKYVGYFDDLQYINRILNTDFTQPNQVKVSLEIKIPAMMVLTDVYHPGWQASDNGQLVPIYRVNYLQRGIWLEEGMHEIEMNFRPRAAYTGRWFSLAGALAAIGWLVWGSIRSRKHHKGDLA